MEIRKLIELLKTLLPKDVRCTGWYGPCGKPAKRQRQNTQYVDDEFNWVTLCPECMDACDEYWAEIFAACELGKASGETRRQVMKLLDER